jgi:hypothetical protein
MMDKVHNNGFKQSALFQGLFLTEIIRGVPQSRQAKVGTVLPLGDNHFLPNPFPKNYSLIIVPFDAM